MARKSRLRAARSASARAKSVAAASARLTSDLARRRLPQGVEANSALQIGHSAAASARPGVGGALVQLLSAPLAVLVDAASFVVSALLVGVISRPEPPPAPTGPGEALPRAMAAGVRALLGLSLLRLIILTSVTSSVAIGAFDALDMLYLTRELGLGPVTLGLIFVVGGIGAILGALLARWAARCCGVGATLLGGRALAALGMLLVPLAAGPAVVVIGLLAASRALDGLAGTVANIHQWSLRQVVTPDHL